MSTEKIVQSGQKCCGRVRGEGRWPTYHDCGKSAKVERDGKHYCLMHDPVRRKEKSEQRYNEYRAKIDADRRLNQVRSAAPALLAACQLALRRLERLGAEDEKETVGPCPACDAIRAALKQAGGEI